MTSSGDRKSNSNDDNQRILENKNMSLVVASPVEAYGYTQLDAMASADTALTKFGFRMFTETALGYVV